MATVLTVFWAFRYVYDADPEQGRFIGWGVGVGLACVLMSCLFVYLGTSLSSAESMEEVFALLLISPLIVVLIMFPIGLLLGGFMAPVIGGLYAYLLREYLRASV